MIRMKQAVAGLGLALLTCACGHQRDSQTAPKQSAASSIIECASTGTRTMRDPRKTEISPTQYTDFYRLNESQQRVFRYDKEKLKWVDSCPQGIKCTSEISNSEITLKQVAIDSTSGMTRNGIINIDRLSGNYQMKHDVEFVFDKRSFLESADGSCKASTGPTKKF